jgi:hypothetical protein
MRKDSMLTAADLDNIITDNFAPDIKKLAHEVGANLYDHDVFEVVCSRIAASYGRREVKLLENEPDSIVGPVLLWKAIELAKIIYGGDEPLWQLIPLSVVTRRKRKQPKPKLSRGTSLPWSKI